MSVEQQYPTSEQIAKALYRRHHQYPAWVELGGDQERWLKDADAVLALFPQPTPSAKPVRYDGHNGLAVLADAARRLSEGTVHRPAEPVSIADMAPGTEFTQQIRWTVRRAADGAPYVENDTDALPGHYIDPSTIRDVTPPARPEQGR